MLYKYNVRITDIIMHNDISYRNFYICIIRIIV